MEGWLVQNWFTLLSAISIIGTLLSTAEALRDETKTRRIGNLLTLTQNHRELWAQMLAFPKLERVLDEKADLEKHPITLSERIFVNGVIQHMNSAYEAMRSGLVIRPEGVAQDIKTFFTLPIPKTIWEKAKVLQNQDLVEFVETAVKKNMIL